jgi:hypothetical protein
VVLVLEMSRSTVNMLGPYKRCQQNKTAIIIIIIIIVVVVVVTTIIIIIIIIIINIQLGLEESEVVEL